jgi:uncharacterized protein YfeS
MRIPQYSHDPGWQRFIAGLVLGIIIGWLLFIILSGIAQERQINLINQQKDQIKELKNEKEIWLDDVKKQNEKLQQKLTIQDIQIDFSNEKEINLGEAEQSKLKGQIKDQLSSLYNQSIETAAANRELINLIQNQPYTIDKNQYRVHIQSLVIYSTVEITLKIEKVK